MFKRQGKGRKIWNGTLSSEKNNKTVAVPGIIPGAAVFFSLFEFFKHFEGFRVTAQDNILGSA